MVTVDSLSIPRMQQQKSISIAAMIRQQLKADSVVCLILSACVLLISTAMHNPVLVEFLAVSFIAISFEKQFLKLVEQVQKTKKLWSLVVGIASFALIGLALETPVLAQASGGLFNPLQQQTNSVLTQAGAGAAGSSIAGIFGLMNIIVAIAGVSAVVYGAYQQSQGHTLRESFTPLAMVLMVYIGCSFVMRLFLGAGGTLS